MKNYHNIMNTFRMILFKGGKEKKEYFFLCVNSLLLKIFI